MLAIIVSQLDNFVTRYCSAAVRFDPADAARSRGRACPWRAHWAGCASSALDEDDAVGHLESTKLGQLVNRRSSLLLIVLRPEGEQLQRPPPWLRLAHSLAQISFISSVRHQLKATGDCCVQSRSCCDRVCGCGCGGRASGGGGGCCPSFVCLFAANV
jgi:hypothetical protein